MRRPLALAVVTACLLGLAGCGASSRTSSVTVPGKHLTIYLSAPAGYARQPNLAAAVAGERQAYRQHAGEVGDGYHLSLQTLSSARLSDNARSAVSDKQAIAYLGELTPGASEQTAGITDALDLLQVSPGDTALELTNATTAVPGAPKRFYESLSSYGRTFARVVPTSAVEAQAQVAKMKALGITRLAVGSDGSDYGRAIAQAVRTDATRGGITASSLSGAQGYFYGSASVSEAGRAFSAALRGDPSVSLFAPSGLAAPGLTGAISPAPQRLYVSMPGFDATALPAAGRRLYASFKASYGTYAYAAMFGYEAMADVLLAIDQAGKSAGDRAQVVKNLLSLRNRNDGVLPGYSIEGGNTTLATFVFLTLRHGALAPLPGVVSG